MAAAYSDALGVAAMLMVQQVWEVTGGVTARGEQVQGLRRLMMMASEEYLAGGGQQVCEAQQVHRPPPWP
jgi:hypothetical protein